MNFTSYSTHTRFTYKPTKTNNMKIGMIILGIIGSLIALAGSVITMIGGFGGTAVGVLGENSATANSGAFVFWSGAIAVVISFMALIFAVSGGSAKRRNTILILSLATLVTGLLNIYLYNWFSGALIAVGGVLGLIGSKDGAEHNVPLKKSPLLYTIVATLVVLVGASVAIKNGSEIIESDSPAVAADMTAPTPEPAAEAAPAAPTAPEPAIAPAAPVADAQPTGQLPFNGRQTFNFMGGNGTEMAISPLDNGHVRVESFGTSGSSVDYEGPFTNPLKISNDQSLLFKDNKVFLTDGTIIQKDCKGEGEECASDLFPST